MCCARLGGNAGPKNRQNSLSGHHRTTLSGYVFATKAHIDIRKKVVKRQCIPTCPHNMVNFGPLAAEIVSLVWGTPANFKGVSRLGFVTAATSLTGGQPNFAWCLAVSLAGRPTLHTFSGALAPWQNFAKCKIHFASMSCLLLYWQGYCTALQQQACEWVSSFLTAHQHIQCHKWWITPEWIRRSKIR